MQKDERRDDIDRDARSPHEQREPTDAEQRGMLCKPSDRNPRREKVRGIMI